MTGRTAEDKKFRRLITNFHEGKVSRAEVAREIHAHSTSISLKSLIKSLQVLFPDARVANHEADVRIDLLCATQALMEKAKYELVCLLFDDAETFDSYSREFFGDHPVTVLHIGGGRHAILDGHHRVRRFADLTGGSRPMAVTVITSGSLDLVARFRQEVEDVRNAANTTDVRKLPLT